MTTIAQALEAAAGNARRIKESLARKRDHEIPPALLVYRGDEMVAQVFPERMHGSDDLIACAMAAAMGFGADVLALVFESFKTEKELNPLTGQRWGPREMEAIADHHDGRAKGWVTDAVTVAVYNRAGDSAVRAMPYRIASRKAVWLEELPTSEGHRFAGYMHDALIKIMKEPTLSQYMVRETGLTGRDFGLTPEEAAAHMDCAITKSFTGRMSAPPGMPPAHVVLAADVGSAREKVIHRSIPGAGTVRP